jgi:hypothetical protein
MINKKMLEYIENDLKNNGFKIIFKPRKYLVEKVGKHNSMQYRGHFDEDGKCIVVANVKEKTKIEILVHEYGHFIQWKKNTRLNKISNRCYDKVSDYMAGKRKTPKCVLKHYIINLIRFEIEADQIGIKILKKFNIEFNEEEYIKSSNIYFFSWANVYYTGKWKNFSGARKGYEVPNIFLSADKYIEGCIHYK